MDRPSVSNRSDRSATKRSVQQSSVNRPVHSEHSPVTPGPRITGTGQTGTRYQDPVPGNTSYTVSDQAQPVRKLKKVQANQCLDQYELLVLNLPVRPVQLEHNVHESLGNMPSVQDEHSSEDSQAFQSLLISDSLDDNAHEYPDGLLCVILNIGLRASVTPITGQTMSIQSTDHVQLGLMLLTTGQFC